VPIRPENRARYPRDWPEISRRIRFERAKGRCEFTVDGERCTAEHGKPHPLTVAHLDHTPESCADDNLLAGCQRCHNRYDMPKRRAGIAERAHAARAAGDLFEAAK
jgi:hypothetical protein